jgi:hypothetical protein
MALVTPATNPGPSPDTSAILLVPPIVGLFAGEDLLAVAPCYIKTSDGKVYQSNGTAATEPAEFAGVTARATKSGQPVTLYGLGSQFRYATFSGQAGDKLFIAATAGRFDTAATTGDAVGTARVLDTERIQIIRAI